MLVEILTGKPLTKLIEVISKGIGDYRKPGQIKKEADAEAYKIEVIEKAKQRAMLVNREMEMDFFQRIETRLIEQETRRQNVIDSVITEAAHQLQNEVVNDESVNRDWAINYFNMVQDVTDKDMQLLWAKILAGETQKPKSFSLRTLELLKKLTRDEALIFSKFAKYAFTDDGQNHSILFTGDAVKRYDLKYSERLLLSEIGLLQLDRHTLQRNRENELPPQEKSYAIFSHGSKAVKVELSKHKTQAYMFVLYFTAIGNELLRLVDIQDDPDYLKVFYDTFKRDGHEVEYVNSLDRNQYEQNNPIRTVRQTPIS